MVVSIIFFVNEKATTESYTYCHTLALHDALPILTDHLHRSATLLPAQRQYSAVFARHQRLSDQIEFEFDGQYSRRRSKSASPLMTTAPATTSGYLYSQIGRAHV